MSSSHLPFVAPGQARASHSIGGASVLELELEGCHAALRRAALVLEHDLEPTVDVGPLARALERSLLHVFDAFDGRGDRVAALLAATSEVDHASAATTANGSPDAALAAIAEHLGQARAHLGRADARLAYAAPRPPAPAAGGPETAAPGILASGDMPRLHTVERASLAPSLVAPTPAGAEPAVEPPGTIPQPKTFDELATAIQELKKRAAALQERGGRASAKPRVTEAPRVVPPGFSADVGHAIDEAAYVRARTRECFEEVALTGMQRAPLLGDPWRGATVLERRMFASIDLCAALGPLAVAHVPRLVADAPVKDPSRAFGVAMVLGCIAGRDALAAAEYALLTAQAEAPFVDEFGAALKLVPHEHVALAARTLLREPEARVRAMAIDTLGYRGLATGAELAAAAIDRPEVAARALHHLAFAPTPELPALLQEASASDDPALVTAAWRAMALTYQPHVAGILTAALAGPHADAAARLLAIAGDERDAAELLARARRQPTVGLVGAVGWAGAASAIGPLIELLESDATGVPEAAAWALERITAAGLFDELEVPAEQIEVAEPAVPDVGERGRPTLAGRVSDPRDLPPPPAPDLLEHPTMDPARWRAWWMEHGTRFDLGARYRRGQPHSPVVLLGELDTARRTPAERRLLQQELVLRTGAFVRFDPHDFVVVQEQSLATWQPIASRSSAAPGRWTRPHRRN